MLQGLPEPSSIWGSTFDNSPVEHQDCDLVQTEKTVAIWNCLQFNGSLTPHRHSRIILFQKMKNSIPLKIFPYGNNEDVFFDFQNEMSLI